MDATCYVGSSLSISAWKLPKSHLLPWHLWGRLTLHVVCMLTNTCTRYRMHNVYVYIYRSTNVSVKQWLFLCLLKCCEYILCQSSKSKFMPTGLKVWHIQTYMYMYNKYHFSPLLLKPIRYTMGKLYIAGLACMYILFLNNSLLTEQHIPGHYCHWPHFKSLHYLHLQVRRLELGPRANHRLQRS